MTTSDLAGIGVTNAETQAAAPGEDPGCSFASGMGTPGSGGLVSPGNGSAVDVAWIATSLDNLYKKRSTMAYWLPTTVNGYPAVYASGMADLRSSGQCDLNVAVNDQSILFVDTLDASMPTQACPVAKRAAADVIARSITS